MALFWLYRMYFVLFSLIEKSTKQLHKSYNKNDFILQNFIPDLFMEETGKHPHQFSPGYATCTPVLIGQIWAGLYIYLFKGAYGTLRMQF